MFDRASSVSQTFNNGDATMFGCRPRPIEITIQRANPAEHLKRDRPPPYPAPVPTFMPAAADAAHVPPIDASADIVPCSTAWAHCVETTPGQMLYLTTLLIGGDDEIAGRHISLGCAVAVPISTPGIQYQ